MSAFISKIRRIVNRVYGLLLLAGAGIVLAFAFRNPVKFYEDFCRYYLMGKMATGPDRLSFYSSAVQAKTIIDFWGGPVFPQGLAFNTPPIVIPFVVVLSLLSLHFAYWLWSFINAGVFLLGIWLILSTRTLGSNQFTSLLLIFAGTLASVPGAMNVAEGQAAGIICGLIAIFFWAYEQKRHIICGITLGLIIFKFQYLPFLLVPVFVGRRWRSLLIMTVIALILVAATALAIGLPNLMDYPSFVLRVEADPHYSQLIDPHSMVNFKGLVDAFFPGLSLTVSFAPLCLALAFLMKIWIDGRDHPAFFPWTVSLTVLVALFFSPHTHNYDSILLVIPFLYACPCLSLAESFAVKPLTVRFWNVILVTMPALSWILRFMDSNPLKLKYLSQIEIDCVLLLLAWLNLKRSGAVSS